MLVPCRAGHARVPQRRSPAFPVLQARRAGRAERRRIIRRGAGEGGEAPVGGNAGRIVVEAVVPGSLGVSVALADAVGEEEKVGPVLPRRRLGRKAKPEGGAPQPHLMLWLAALSGSSSSKQRW